MADLHPTVALRSHIDILLSLLPVLQQPRTLYLLHALLAAQDAGCKETIISQKEIHFLYCYFTRHGNIVGRKKKTTETKNHYISNYMPNPRTPEPYEP
eukprot:COSAG02_NODE_29461_length_568_cov_2.447761_1_plen_97_part_01